MKTIKINNQVLNEESRPFIVAEAGVNHENDMELARRLIDEAVLGKADAIKFQTYKAEKIAAIDSPTYWDASISQRDYFKKYDKFGEDEYRELAKYAEKKGIIFMSTPFDFEAVDILDKLVPIFKISSSDITNIPFLKYIAKKDKPIFLSTGASTIGEIEDAVLAITGEGNKKIVILHCKFTKYLYIYIQGVHIHSLFHKVSFKPSFQSFLFLLFQAYRLLFHTPYCYKPNHIYTYFPFHFCILQ